MLMQKFGVTNKEHYGMLWYFLEWSIGTLLEKALGNWSFISNLALVVESVTMSHPAISEEIPDLSLRACLINDQKGLQVGGLFSASLGSKISST